MASGVIAFPFELAIYTIFAGAACEMENGKWKTLPPPPPHIYLLCGSRLALLSGLLVWQR